MKQPILGTNIADWKEHWDHFNLDLYVRILIAKQNKLDKYEKG
jgi:hypothetical protein